MLQMTKFRVGGKRLKCREELESASISRQKRSDDPSSLCTISNRRSGLYIGTQTYLSDDQDNVESYAELLLVSHSRATQLQCGVSKTQFTRPEMIIGFYETVVPSQNPSSGAVAACCWLSLCGTELHLCSYRGLLISSLRNLTPRPTKRKRTRHLWLYVLPISRLIQRNAIIDWMLIHGTFLGGQMQYCITEIGILRPANEHRMEEESAVSPRA